MKKRKNLKIWWAISVFLLALGIGTSSVLATGSYDGGDGSEASPFQINTAAQMNEIGQHSEDWGSHFILTADIDLSDYTGTQFHIIGVYAMPQFTGSFGGNGHTISNFTYTTMGDYIGLFGRVGTGGEIKDLGLLNVNVNAGSGSMYIGGLVGYNCGTILDCYAAGTVSGQEVVGGLMG